MLFDTRLWKQSFDLFVFSSSYRLIYYSEMKNICTSSKKLTGQLCTTCFTTLGKKNIRLCSSCTVLSVLLFNYKVLHTRWQILKVCRYVEVNMNSAALVWPLFNSLQAFWPGLQVINNYSLFSENYKKVLYIMHTQYWVFNHMGNEGFSWRYWSCYAHTYGLL